jgi:DNA transposition AAA+ family ATPase
MALSAQHRDIIHKEIIEDFNRKVKDDRSYTQARHAISLEINPSIHSRLVKGEKDRLMSESEWKRVGMSLGIEKNGIKWIPAITETSIHITTQLEECQNNSLCGIFVDKKGIGKTYAAKTYTLQHANAALVDCSINKTKSELIREIAKKFGFTHTGRLKDVRRNLIDNIFSLRDPLLILDEAGDLQYAAFVEIKSLINETEGYLGVYIMGANGLREKIRRNIDAEKVGYEEIFDRLGDSFQSLTLGKNAAEVALFDRQQAMAVLKAQLPKISKKDGEEMLTTSRCNQRTLRTKIVKYLNPAA